MCEVAIIKSIYRKKYILDDLIILHDDRLINYLDVFFKLRVYYNIRFLNILKSSV